MSLGCVLSSAPTLAKSLADSQVHVWQGSQSLGHISEVTPLQGTEWEVACLSLAGLEVTSIWVALLQE